MGGPRRNAGRFINGNVARATRSSSSAPSWRTRTGFAEQVGVDSAEGADQLDAAKGAPAGEQGRGGPRSLTPHRHPPGPATSAAPVCCAGRGHTTSHRHHRRCAPQQYGEDALARHPRHPQRARISSKTAVTTRESSSDPPQPRRFLKNKNTVVPSVRRSTRATSARAFPFKRSWGLVRCTRSLECRAPSCGRLVLWVPSRRRRNP